MDASAVLTLVQTFLQVLDSPISREIGFVWGYKSQLRKLGKTMSTIEDALLDAEELEKRRPLRHALKNRLERLQEAVYRADDLFDEVATVAQRKKLISGNKVGKEVRLFFTRFNQLYSAFKMSHEIRDIRDMLDDIKKDDDIIGSIQPSNMEMSYNYYNTRESHSFVCEEDVIIGRDDDKQTVIDMLFDDAAATVEEAVSVVSIVGIGGLGKTALAQLVYNDDRIQREFQLKMWVCVSDDFNVQALLGKIIAAATNETISSGISMDQLQTKLRQALDGKKYLLVLDDIWNEDPNKWHELRKLLIQGGMGSRIIVTTRSMKVASIVGGHQTLELKGLSDQDSWNLFHKMTLEPGKHLMEQQFLEIGKDFVRKCVNVPLALKVIGSVLRGQCESQWRSLANIDLANIVQDKNRNVLDVLKISYNYLLPLLKNCFTYCAVFPKDYRMKKEDLIYQWMAQGFIMPSNGQSFEDLGEDCFINLLQRCFFQDVQRDDITEVIVSCKMHDLIHDLAKKVAGTRIKSCSYGTSASSDETRHMFIDDQIVKMENIECYITKMKRLRTCLGCHSNIICSYDWLPKMKYLRVLDMSRELGEEANLKKLPRMMGKLVHLRYLDLSHNDELSGIPDSITKLFNLQTLKLNACRKLEELPRELSNLVNLRYLDTRDCDKLRHMPPGMNRMTNLHKLTMFKVGEREPNNNGVGKLGDLMYLNNLRDHIEIKIGIDSTYNVAEVEVGGCLRNKLLLNDVKISWNCVSVDNTEALFQDLQPHPNVKKLRLYNYSGVKFPSWGDGDSLMNLSPHLPKLVGLELVGCTRLKHVPLLSQLQHLKVLSLERLWELEHVENGDNRSSVDGATTISGGRRQGSAHESIFFPSPEKLELRYLQKLKGWWKVSSHSDSDDGEGEIDIVGNNYNEQLQQEEELSIVAFPSLSDLQIVECPKLMSFPSIPKVKKLRLSGSSKFLRYLDSLPGESFQQLSDLTILKDDEIERLTTREVFRSGRLSSLRSLQFDRCRKLKSIRGRGVWGHFTALESLDLRDLDELEMEDNEADVDNNMPWRCLAPSLRTLKLIGLPKMGKLPMGMRHLTSLQQLRIHDCGNLEEIPGWISCLTSLQRLDIWSCPKVKSLPEQMRHLTSLTQLDLNGCSAELRERC